MFSRIGLTLKMLMLTAMLGIAVWLVSDAYQTRTLKQIFNEKLAERFGIEAQEHRTSFDRQVKIYSQAAKLLAGTYQLHDYLNQPAWRHGANRPLVHHEDKPAWIPAHSIMRQFVMPRYAILLDTAGKAREVYNWDQTEPSALLLPPSALLLRLSTNQSYLTLLAKEPYLVTSEPVYIGGKHVATLLLASPLDSEFLRESQTLSSTRHTVAIMSEDDETIMVSSDPEKVPNGIHLAELSGVYQTVGKGFFDYGSSDLVIRFVSFIPLQEVQDLTQAVLNRARQQRSVVTAAYILLFMLIMFYLTRRLRSLTDRVVEFSNNMAIQQPQIDSNDELDILEDSFKNLTSAVKHETEALEYHASHDALTGLPNRSLFKDRLTQALLRAHRNNSMVALMFLDLDRFKMINDTLGHDAGDKLLQYVAKLLQQAVRHSDTVLFKDNEDEDEQTVSRLGGDEFTIILEGLRNAEGAATVAQNIIFAFTQPVTLAEREIFASASIGIAMYPHDAADQESLIKSADTAMYRAKESGRNAFHFYTADLNTQVHNRLTLETELRRAVERKEFVLYYQPKVVVSNNEVVGVEALIRWKHPEKGLIPPDVFIPVLEDMGLIVAVGEWMLRSACEQQLIWVKAGKNPLTMSVNLSGRQLMQKNLVERITGILDETGMQPGFLEFELTESILMQHTESNIATMAKIVSTGIRISIDDFGTGYSSLSYLKRFSVSTLKIDKSFVSELSSNQEDISIVRAIIALADSLKITVIAEGVETQEQLDILRTLGCHQVQGYLLGHPAPAELLVLI